MYCIPFDFTVSYSIIRPGNRVYQSSLGHLLQSVFDGTGADLCPFSDLLTDHHILCPPVILPRWAASHFVPAVYIHATSLSLYFSSMSVSPSFHRPRPLRLSISNNPPPVRDYVTATSTTSSAPRREPWGYESPSGECYERICSVICLYDFSSSDSDHLSFRRNEVLNIVRKEESGWWAAVRGDVSEVGWIPATYVDILSDDAAEGPYTETPVPDCGADQESVTSTSLFSGDTPSATFDDHEPPDTIQVGHSFRAGHSYSC